MKKLLFALTVLTVGYVASAATINWNAWQYAGGEMANYAYFVDSQGSAYLTNPTGIDIVLCLMNGSTVSEVVQVGENNGSGVVSGNYMWEYGTKHAVGNTFKVMLRDATGQETVYRELAAAQNSAGNDPTTFNTLTIDSTYATLQDAWSNDFVYATGNYQDVPEPTSGLMLALGLVALGLKRKQRKV